MQPSSDLFDLIKSLSIQEKRYFKLFAKRYSPNGQEKKYLQLFKAIEKQSLYDETSLKANLAGEISAASFGSWKRHLHSYVEQALREFHAGKDSVEVVHELLRDAELMTRRGLWNRAHKKIAEAKKMATKLDDNLSLLKINESERRILLEFGKAGIAEEMAALLDQAVKFMQRLQEEQALAALFDDICLLIRLEFDPRSKLVASSLPRLMGDPRLAPDVALSGFKARRYYHQARAFLFHLSGDRKAELSEYEALLDHWDQYSYLKVIHPKLYKLSLTNYLHAANKMMHWGRFPEVLSAVGSLPADNLDEEAEDFQTVQFYQHLYYLDTHQLKQSLEMIPKLEAGLHRYAPKINVARWLSIQINIAFTHFLNEDMVAASTSLEGILTHARSEHRPDAKALARLIDPIVTLELEGEDRCQQKVHALREWLRMHQRLQEFERLVVTHLDWLTNSAPTSKRMYFGKLTDALEVILRQPAPPPGAEVVYLWAKARATGSSIRDLFTQQ